MHLCLYAYALGDNPNHDHHTRGVAANVQRCALTDYAKQDCKAILAAHKHRWKQHHTNGDHTVCR